jgi:hypothetical protein
MRPVLYSQIRINSLFVRESYDNGSSVRGNFNGMISVVVLLSWIGLRLNNR